MKSQNKILLAFLLNLGFSLFEFLGGIITGSVAISSDAVHDFGDAISIGIAFLLEKKSKKAPDDQYTYGYARFSLVGSVITTLILLIGSAAVIFNAIKIIIHPAPIDYDGMIIFACFGTAVNFAAALITKDGNSLNQKAINLHMLEDVLGWFVVLVGAIVMRFTDFYIIDPLMSLGVAIFIFSRAVRNLSEALNIFLEKIPSGIDIGEIKNNICEIDGVVGVHHIHIWSMDGESNYLTMHLVVNSDSVEIKKKVREKLNHYGISHATLELESEGESCPDAQSQTETHIQHFKHHHHHHH